MRRRLGAAVSVRRMDSPSSSMRWAPGRTRSKTASASVGLPSAWCHMATGSWLVKMVERNPELVLDDLQGVGGLVGAERPQQKVVDDQDVDACPGGQKARETPVGMGDGQFVEHAWGRR